MLWHNDCVLVCPATRIPLRDLGGAGEGRRALPAGSGRTPEPSLALSLGAESLASPLLSLLRDVNLQECGLGAKRRGESWSFHFPAEPGPDGRAGQGAGPGLEEPSAISRAQTFMCWALVARGAVSTSECGPLGSSPQGTRSSYCIQGKEDAALSPPPCSLWACFSHVLALWTTSQITKTQKLEPEPET